jgi:hypothetical protein
MGMTTGENLREPIEVTPIEKEGNGTPPPPPIIPLALDDINKTIKAGDEM